MRATLTRCSPLLLLLCLSGCGQTGKLYLLLPDIEFPTLAPPLSTHMPPILAMPGTVISAPVSATAPRLPAAHPAPSAGTRPLPPGASPLR